MRTILSIFFLFFLISCKKVVQKKKEIYQVGFDKIKDSIIDLKKYKSGQVEYVIYAKDSGKCEELHINYYKNGQLKMKGCYGHFGPWGVPVRTWYFYDSLGTLTLKKIFIHHKVNGTLKTIKYNKKGAVEEKTEGYDAHYGELDTIWKWSLIDENGKITDKLKD